MKAINIAIRRTDGKVECDTLYRDSMFTQEEIDKMSNDMNCEIIASCIGKIVFDSKRNIDKNTIISKKKEVEEDVEAQTEDDIPQSDTVESDSTQS